MGHLLVGQVAADQGEGLAMAEEIGRWNEVGRATASRCVGPTDPGGLTDPLDQVERRPHLRSHAGPAFGTMPGWDPSRSLQGLSFSWPPSSASGWSRHAAAAAGARRDEAERGTDDAAMRAEVLERLTRAAAQWDGAAGTAGMGAGGTGGTASSGVGEVAGAPQVRGTDPAETRPEARPEPARAADEPARHGRPGHRIRLRGHPRA